MRVTSQCQGVAPIEPWQSTILASILREAVATHTLHSVIKTIASTLAAQLNDPSRTIFVAEGKETKSTTWILVYQREGTAGGRA